MRILLPNPNINIANVNRILIIVEEPVFYPFLERLLALLNNLLGLTVTGKSWDRIRRIPYATYRRIKPKRSDKLLPYWVQQFKCMYPASSIHLLLGGRADSQLSSGEIHTLVDRTMRYPRKHLSLALLDSHFLGSLKQERYDLAVILYPDAIGIGCLTYDLLSFMARPAHSIACNGRKRAFVLTFPVLARLLALRLIDKFWVTNLCAVPLLLIGLTISLSGHWWVGDKT